MICTKNCAIGLDRVAGVCYLVEKYQPEILLLGATGLGRDLGSLDEVLGHKRRYTAESLRRVAAEVLSV